MTPKVGMTVEYTDPRWERSWATITKVWNDRLVNLITVGNRPATSVPYSAKDLPNHWRFVGEFEMAQPSDPEYAIAVKGLWAPPIPEGIAA